MRIGVLTGGGDCPGLNAVIRAVTKSLLRQCGAHVIGIEDGFGHVIDLDDINGSRDEPHRLFPNRWCDADMVGGSVNAGGRFCNAAAL